MCIWKAALLFVQTESAIYSTEFWFISPDIERLQTATADRTDDRTGR